MKYKNITDKVIFLKKKEGWVNLYPKKAIDLDLRINKKGLKLVEEKVVKKDIKEKTLIEEKKEEKLFEKEDVVEIFVSENNSEPIKKETKKETNEIEELDINELFKKLKKSKDNLNDFAAKHDVCKIDSTMSKKTMIKKIKEGLKA